MWVRGPLHGIATLIIENGKAKDDVEDHFRNPSMQCNDLEVSNITQTEEGYYQCLCENEKSIYKLNILSGK